ncbi:MAG TPA: hypothetical protein GXX36_11755 [Clostridiaceae bacterium]|nr:hypothetical protein [Clostridiaceae bacterium]
MFFGKQNTRIRKIKNMHPIIFLPLLIAIIIAFSACSAPKGSIVILEDPNGTGFTMDFKKWSSKDKCRLSLNEGDELQVEVVHEDGEIDLMINGKNGSEPYSGNDLKSIAFTVAVSETDEYDIRITGKDATGRVTVKNAKSIFK